MKKFTSSSALQIKKEQSAKRKKIVALNLVLLAASLMLLGVLIFSDSPLSSLAKKPVSQQVARISSPTRSKKTAATPTPQPVVKQAYAAGADYCLTVPLLLYHHIQPLAEATKAGQATLTVDSSYFDEQMNYLVTQGYHTLSINQLVTALTQHTPLPDKSIAVTIDDGYLDAFLYAYPTLKKYHLVGNFMLPTGLLGTNGYLTWDNVKQMAATSSMHFYNHSWSHPDLTTLSSDKLEEEVTLSQTQLQLNLGTKEQIFTYPYGSYNAQVIDTLTKHGYTAALTTLPGAVQCESTLLTLHRDHVGNASLNSYGL